MSYNKSPTKIRTPVVQNMKVVKGLRSDFAGPVISQKQIMVDHRHSTLQNLQNLRMKNDIVQKQVKIEKERNDMLNQIRGALKTFSSEYGAQMTSELHQTYIKRVLYDQGVNHINGEFGNLLELNPKIPNIMQVVDLNTDAPPWGGGTPGPIKNGLTIPSSTPSVANL